jgi:hypothetical protein
MWANDRSKRAGRVALLGTVLLLAAAGCNSSSTDATTPPTASTTSTAPPGSIVYSPLTSADQLKGLWLDTKHGVYLDFDAEGGWLLYDQIVYDPDDPVPDHSGTYTLDGAEITMFDHPETSICAGEVGVWIVGVSEGGNEAAFTFVEDSCTVSARSEDWTLVRSSD